jgi:hypothetical protein
MTATRSYTAITFIASFTLLLQLGLSCDTWAQKNDPKNDATMKAPSQKKQHKNNKSMANSSGDAVERKSDGNAGMSEAGLTKAPKTKDRNKQNKDMANNTGDVLESQSKMNGPKHQVAYALPDTKARNKKGKEMANNTGDMPLRVSNMQPPKHEHYVIVDNSKQRELTKEMSRYQGDIIAPELDRAKMKKMARYQGDLPNNFLEKRAKSREEKSREMSSCQGDISVKTLEARAKNIRKKSKQMANFQGDIIVHKKKSGMHPSSVYRGGLVKNSYAAKERYRQRMMKQNNKNADKDENVPQYLKKNKKDQRPSYDSREAEIWNLKQPSK